MIDHLVYATPDLASTVDLLNRRLGLTLGPGGPHPGLGTRNFIADLGSGGYLEVVGPDPDQPAPERPRMFGIDHLTEPALVTWAASVQDLNEVVRQARGAGHEMRDVISMSRVRPDGRLLEWRMSLAPDQGGVGLLPFLIEWGDVPHPSSSAVHGLRLVALTGTHPDPVRIERGLSAIGEWITVEKGPRPALRAVLETPNGETVL